MKFIITTILSCFFITTQAQLDLSERTFNTITLSINKNKNLVSINDTLLLVLQLAKSQQNEGAIAHCYYLQVQIADKKSEDTFYLKNMSIYEKELAQSTSPVMQSMMHILLAKRLKSFSSKYFWSSKKSLMIDNNPTVEYRNLTKPQLDSIIDWHYKQAISKSKIQPVKNIPDYLWLSYNHLLFLFKPTLTDIFYQEYINTKKENGLSFYAADISWLSLSQDDFFSKGDTLNALKGNPKEIFMLYKEWAITQGQNPSAYYFIETLARKTFSDAIYYYKNDKDSLLSIYLNYLLQSPYNTVKAHGVLQKFKQMLADAKKYNGKDLYGYNSPVLVNFDTSKRLLNVQAIEFYKSNKAVLDSFPYLQNDIEEIIDGLKDAYLKMWASNYIVPNKTTQLYVQYKNCTGIYTTIVKVNDTFSEAKMSSKKVIDTLQKISAYITTFTSLVELNDFQLHRTYIALDKLNAGKYYLLYSNASIVDSNQHIEYLQVNVTGTAVVNNNKNIFVLDRITGQPLVNTKIYFGKTVGNKIIFSNEAIVNKLGIVENKFEATQIKVCNTQDTTIFSLNRNDDENDKPDNVYSTDEDDSKADYYTDNVSLQIFTDRAIYRPGQTVYFKGIATVPDIKTGKPLPLTWKSLKLPFFNKIYYKLVKLFTKIRPEVYITDPFNREMDTIKFMPNKYGSFAGKFVIPKDASTGEWGFDSDFDLSNSNEGSFKVEEYKRPSFEIKVEKPKEELYLKDSAAIKIKVKSFACVQLNNVKVEYTLSKSYSSSFDELFSKEAMNHLEKTIDTFGFTNNKGELIIKIDKDSLVNNYTFSDSFFYRIDYNLYATVIDETGENYSINDYFILSNQPINIRFEANKYYNKEDLLPIKIITKHNLFGTIRKPIKIKVYKKLVALKKAISSNDYATDVNLQTNSYSLKNNALLFPEEVEKEQFIFEKTILPTENNLFQLPKELITAGNYIVKANCLNNNEIVGTGNYSFEVYDSKTNELPNINNEFHYLKSNQVLSGDTFHLVKGNSDSAFYAIYHLAYYVKQNGKVKLVNDYITQQEKKGIQFFKYKIPKYAIDKVYLNCLYVLDNDINKISETIHIQAPTQLPEIIVEQYRKVLTPGAKETFTVSIKTKNENTLAELMTTMYDASLDKIEKHNWRIQNDRTHYNWYSNWNNAISAIIDKEINYRSEITYNFSTHKRKVEPLWWLNPLDYAYTNNQVKVGEVLIMNNKDILDKTLYMKSEQVTSQWQQGRSAGLNEVVVTSSYSAKALAGSVSGVQLRGITSLQNYSQPFIILDGVVYTGELNKINVNTITEAIVLKGADASAIYGSKAAEGVLIISTKGPIQLQQPQEPPITVRKNFNETAFFYPTIYANADGYYNIEFTIPESVTEWKWKLFAHTKQMKYAYTEKTIYTQLPLMVQPDMPRFLYQGDLIHLKTRISNLDSIQLNGNATCIIEDAITGENITQAVLKENKTSFTVNAQSNTTKGFYMQIPDDFLHPIKIIIKAATVNYADGEEHIIPILSKNVLVTQSQPFSFSDKQKNILLPTLPANAQAFAQGIFVTPQPQAAIVNALPSMAFYQYNCAEQITNKLLAYATAIKLMRTDSTLQQAFLAYKKTNITQTKLPDEINENTMPWLNLVNNNNNQQQQLAKLLDTTVAANKMIELFGKLKELQNQDGGFTWFNGGKTDVHISNYLLSSFGKIVQLKLPLKIDWNEQNSISTLQTIIDKLINYCDVQIANNEFISSSYIYGRSFWLNKYPLSDSLKNLIRKQISKDWKDGYDFSLHNQALLIINSLRYFSLNEDEYKKALAQITSIEQLAINDNNGMRWKDMADENDLSYNTEETIALLADAFKEASSSNKNIEEMIKWILAAKQEHSWSSTKATASVINLLLANKIAANSNTSVTCTIANKKLEASNNLLQNKPVNVTLLNNEPFTQNILLQQKSNANVSGNMIYYYFTSKPPISTSNLQLSKKMEYLNKKTNQLEFITDTTMLHIGDNITVTLHIQSAKRLSYVFIEDKHAANFQNTETSSGYEYGNDMVYYKSVRDAGTQFFANNINAGTHNIIYNLIVSKEGKFNNGFASLQCMYKPGIKVYSNQQIVNSE